MSVTVRPATESDVPAVLPMVQQLADLHEAWDAERFPYLPEIGRRYDRWLRQRAADPHSAFFVAVDDDDAGRVVGFIVATTESDIPIYRVTEMGYVHDLWVDPARRATGVGRRLVEAALARFAALGLTRVRLETAAANEPARRLLAACGFRVVAVEMQREISPGEAGR